MKNFYHHILYLGRFYSIFIGILSSALVTILLSPNINNSYLCVILFCILMIAGLSAFLSICDEYAEHYIINIRNGNKKADAQDYALSSLMDNGDKNNRIKTKIWMFLVLEIGLLIAIYYCSHKGRTLNAQQEEKNHKKTEKIQAENTNQITDKINQLNSVLQQMDQKIDSIQYTQPKRQPNKTENNKNK